jgi:hypothetical protein
VTKLINQFSHLNLGYYGKTTQKLFCGPEASNHPESSPHLVAVKNIVSHVDPQVRIMLGAENESQKIIIQ